MGKSLDEIAQELKDSNKKVQLIYAFNGTGKTRLSRAFKELVAPKNQLEEEAGLASKKILYYNAFTEDLFYWDNDLLFVSNKVISDYERGIHFPRDERIITTLANHFGVSIDYLFGITNIKNHTYSNDFLIVFHSLTPTQKNEVIDFMQFLATKNN